MSQWRKPDSHEAELLEKYFIQKKKCGNIVFTVWIVFGILGMAVTTVNVIKSVITEPEGRIFSLLSGGIGIWLLYMFFVKLGSYVKNKSLRQELEALKNNQVEICESKAIGKKRVISHLRSGGHIFSHNYYIKTKYQGCSDAITDITEADILVTSDEYKKIGENDKIYIISSNHKRLPNYMSAVNKNFFNQ